MGEADIGMLSTVLIGNSNTYIKHGLMVTPRGYANKYALEEGERNTYAGEQAGRSLSTGLSGWMATIQESGKSVAELAAEYRLPEEYIAAVLQTELPPEGEENALEG